jgi:hypothetical protein
MEQEGQSRSAVWWAATLKGAVTGLATGLAIGVASALLLQFALIPLMPSIGAVFAGFLTLTPAAAASWGGVVPLASFSVVPLAIFSGLSGMLGNMIGSGNRAIAAKEQEYASREHERKLHVLEGRTQLLEQEVAPSRAVQQILARGGHTHAGFAVAEAARAEARPTSPTLH